MAKVIDATVRLIDQVTPVLGHVNRAIDTTKTAFRSANTSIKNASNTTKVYAKDMEEAEKINQRVSKSIQGIGKDISSVSKKMGMLSLPLIGAAMEGLKLNSEYTDGLAKVSTALDTQKISLGEVRKGLIDVSNQTGIAVTQLTDAEYQTLSAGIASEKSVQFLGDAMKASKAGFADAATTIDTVTTVLNSYGMAADKATDVTDQMITAQNFGKTTFADMGASLGQVIPVAAALDVKTQELFSSIATLTKNGVRTSEAITGLKAAYSNIIKPSSEAQKMAASLGLEFNSAHLKAVGWAKFLDEVREKTGGNTENMAKLFGSVEALNTITVLTGKGHEDLAAAMEKMNNAAGTTQEAYEKLLTPAEQNRIALNQLKNAGMEMAQGLTPVLKTTAVALKNFANFLNGLSDSQKDMLMTVGKYIIIFAVMSTTVGKAVGIFGDLFGSVTSVAAAITKAGGIIPLLTGKLASLAGNLRMVGMAARVLFANPIGIAVLTVIALAYLVYTHWEPVKEFFVNLWDFVSAAFAAGIAKIKEWMDKTGITEKLQVIGAKLPAMLSAWKTMWTAFFTWIVSFGAKIWTPIINAVVYLWNMVIGKSQAGSSTLGIIFSVIRFAVVNGFAVMVNVAISLFSGFLNHVLIICTGIMDIFMGIIHFITGVFTGNWSQAWQGVVEIFSGIFNMITGICQNVLGTVKSIINDVIGGINNISVDIPEWVPGVGGKQFTPNIPMLATGTDNWRGGPAMIHDAGPEIIDLPPGTRVIPHDKSLQQEYERGKAAGSKGSLQIHIDKLADNIVIREEADIDKVVNKLAEKLESHAMNQAEGAI